MFKALLRSRIFKSLHPSRYESLEKNLLRELKPQKIRLGRRVYK